MAVGDQTKIDVAASGPARQRLARGIGLLYKLGFDVPAGNRSRFGLLITIHDCRSMPGECDDVRADLNEARAYPQLEYGACTVVVDEAAVAATAGQLRVATDRWVAAVLAHELTHCDGQEREDVAETRGTLWVGRQLGDLRIVQDALHAITYDIDQDGHWRSRAAATSTIGLVRTTRWTRSKVAGSSGWASHECLDTNSDISLLCRDPGARGNRPRFARRARDPAPKRGPADVRCWSKS
jgi:hypothetical protein